MLLLLRRMVLVVLALSSAGLGVALSLASTPSSAVLRSIPLWEATEMVLPNASDSEPQPKISPHASLGRDIV